MAKDKWGKFGSYENWQQSNSARLKNDYNDYMDKNYNLVMPDTYVSFDDFCMATWQWMD